MHLTKWDNNRPVLDFDLEDPEDRQRLVDYLNRHGGQSWEWELSQLGEQVTQAFLDAQAEQVREALPRRRERRS